MPSEQWQRAKDRRQRAYRRIWGRHRAVAAAVTDDYVHVILSCLSVFPLSAERCYIPTAGRSSVMLHLTLNLESLARLSCRDNLGLYKRFRFVLSFSLFGWTDISSVSCFLGDGAVSWPSFGIPDVGLVLSHSGYPAFSERLDSTGLRVPSCCISIFVVPLLMSRICVFYLLVFFQLVCDQEVIRSGCSQFSAVSSCFNFYCPKVWLLPTNLCYGGCTISIAINPVNSIELF